MINAHKVGLRRAKGNAMNTPLKRLLYWSPRILCILFAAFLSLFALDVFDGRHGFWQTMLALLIHLIPVFVLILALVIAWRWEWVGAVLYAAAGTLYVVTTLRIPHLHARIKLLWCSTIAGPAFVIAALFLVNWLYRKELHGRA
jgi:hypothetical protein